MSPRPADRLEAKVKQTYPNAVVVERSARGLTLDLGNGQRVYTGTSGRVHDDQGVPFDQDFEPAAGEFFQRGKYLGFGVSLRANGGYRYTPDPNVPGEFVDVGRLEYDDGGIWKVLPLTQRAVVDNRAEWESPQGDYLIVVKLHAIRTRWVLTDETHNTGWRWDMTFSGLTPDAEHWVTWTDSSIPRETDQVQVIVDGTHHRIGPLPAGLVYPVTVKR